MFSKILIANRGEIACRVIATARTLGAATVAVYSDADAGAKHVALADEAVRIGPPPTAESYLRGDVIIEAALRMGAQAIHPGYGFLSENPDFVEAVEAAGLVFIGPPADAIRAMGLKDAAKALMEKAGVPVVPGYHGDRQDTAFLEGEADAIGYPVLIKARAGGGGKGMRKVDDPKDFAEAFAAAQREGQASFGDPTCLVEKYIAKPRHVEIQVFGDGHGDVVHLFERDCSLQRRHQKVIEEAPAPFMPSDVREAMGAAAVEAARAIGYQGAGTVEFIADGSGPLKTDGFWFMEMNTRLQVEHPVTEAITGLDLVELQLRVAAGEPLPFAQEDLAIDGHAFEARVYAEDAAKGFLPATGRLGLFRTPEASAFELAPVRIDAGVHEGDEITPHYDPMIAKVIVHGPTRAAALSRLAATLAEIRIAGSVTNLEFLGALARHEGFAKGDVDTGLIGRDLDTLTASPAADDMVIALAAIEALGLFADPAGGDPWSSLRGWRQWTPAAQRAVLLQEGDPLERIVEIGPEGRFTVAGDAAPVEIAASVDGDGRLRFASDGVARSAHVATVGNEIVVFLDGAAFVFSRPDPFATATEDGAGGDQVAAPMSGLVRTVRVSVGDAVAKGDPLLMLEAMKMEHTLTAPRDGVVAEVLVNAEEQVAEGDLLIRFEMEEA